MISTKPGVSFACSTTQLDLDNLKLEDILKVGQEQADFRATLHPRTVSAREEQRLLNEQRHEKAGTEIMKTQDRHAGQGGGNACAKAYQKLPWHGWFGPYPD